jgi:HlyD family secretion protein
MVRRSSGLVGLYERCVDWLRTPGGRRSTGLGPRPSVDLVGLAQPSEPAENGTTTFGTRPSSPKPVPPPPAPPAKQTALASNGFGSSSLTNNISAPPTPWSFNQTVLLRKQNRGSSVMVWAGVGTVAALGIWAAESIRQRLLNENQIAAATLGDGSATSALSANQRLQLASQAEEFTSRREAARQELRKAQERLAGERASLATYQNIATRIAGLVSQGAASEVQFLEARQNVQKSQSSIAQEQREIARLESSLVNTSATTNVELRRKVEENLRQIAQLDSDIRQARQQIQFGLLTAPANGTVFDVEVSPGSVVAQGTGTSANASGKSLMKVVPNDALRARVYLPNEAIGFVRPGLRADLQIQAFDASDFGTVPAVVERIGSDALPADEQKQVLGTDSSGLFYPAVMRLERQTIPLGQSEAPLQAGMKLTANITLRERRFINIFTGFFEDQRRNLERIR